jgi:hypothetical protein
MPQDAEIHGDRLQSTTSSTVSMECLLGQQISHQFVLYSNLK